MIIIGVELAAVALAGSIMNVQIRSGKLMAAMIGLAFVGMALICLGIR